MMTCYDVKEYRICYRPTKRHCPPSHCCCCPGQHPQNYNQGNSLISYDGGATYQEYKPIDGTTPSLTNETQSRPETQSGGGCVDRNGNSIPCGQTVPPLATQPTTQAQSGGGCVDRSGNSIPCGQTVPPLATQPTTQAQSGGGCVDRNGNSIPCGQTVPPLATQPTTQAQSGGGCVDRNGNSIPCGQTVPPLATQPTSTWSGGGSAVNPAWSKPDEPTSTWSGGGSAVNPAWSKPDEPEWGTDVGGPLGPRPATQPTTQAQSGGGCVDRNGNSIPCGQTVPPLATQPTTQAQSGGGCVDRNGNSIPCGQTVPPLAPQPTTQAQSGGGCVDRNGNSFPCGKTVPDPYADPSIYEPVGLPGEIGLEPFNDLSPTDKEIETQNQYEETVDQWFSKPTTTTNPLSAIAAPSYTATPDYPTSVESVNYQTALNSEISHAPDDISWIDWTGTEWDGIPIDPTNMPYNEICDFLRPLGSPYVVRGIRELFYTVNPFADPANPTPLEIEDWNVEVINHIRRMMGFTVMVQKDARLFLETRWADERKFTQYWDTKYPEGQIGTATGPCWNAQGTGVDIADGHCGASFFPDATDRAPYTAGYDVQKYPELANYTNSVSQRESVKTVNSSLPWSIKVSSMMSGFICGEGLTGHAGSFLGRAYMGVSWHVYHDGVHGTRGRFKWR